MLLLSGTTFNSENGSALRYGSTLILDSGQFAGLNWLNEPCLTVGGNQGHLASSLVPRLDVPRDVLIIVVVIVRGNVSGWKAFLKGRVPGIRTGTELQRSRGPAWETSVVLPMSRFLLLRNRAG